MKLFVKSLAVIAAASLVSAETEGSSLPQCNPAVQCPSNSIECFPCNPRLDTDCDIKTMNIRREGECIEPAPIDIKKKVYGMFYHERCRRVVDVDYRNAKKTPDPEDYIKSCQEGRYTCNDGTCETAKGFPKECYNGIVDSELIKDHPCNMKDIETVTKINDWFDTLDHSKYCKKTGIRFGPLRCNRAVARDVSSENCGVGEEPKPETCQKSDGTISLVGPADACTATCEPFQELFQKPGCCIDEPGRVCSDFTVYVPSEDIRRCDESDIEDEGCEICQGANSTEFPYCCLAGSEPVCVDFFGLDKDGERTKCTDGKPADGIKGDVCYVSSSGSTATPPAISDTGFGASGVELTFKFEKPDEQDTENDCCCDLICSCFGDPHCTSFYGDYEVSQDEDGTYIMVDEGGVFIEGELGVPLGVTKTYNIKLGKLLVEVRDEECVFGEGIFLDGSDTPTTDLTGYPQIQYIDNSGDKSLAKDKLNKNLAINPSFVKMQHGDYDITIECIRFKMTKGKRKGWHNRMDINVKRKVDEVQAEPGCCPEPDTVYKELGFDANQGFCFRHPSEAGSTLPNPLEYTDFRRLSTAEMAAKAIRHLEEDECTETVIKMLMDKFGWSEQRARAECEENGKDAMRDLIKSVDDTCLYYANDQAFVYDASTAKCEEGLILEAKLPTQKSWTPIRFFPKSASYCDNKVLVIFEHTMVGKKKLNQNYELRLRSCTPEATCGANGRNPCTPYGGVSNLGVSKYTYGSTLTDAIVELVTFAAKECECGNDASNCIVACMVSGNCPAKGTCP